MRLIELLEGPNDSGRRFLCLGSSMKPTILSLDVVEIEPYSHGRIRPGDIAIFISPGTDRKVAHRIISARSGRIMTKGDNNRRTDVSSIPPDNILGKAVFIERGKRRIRVYGGARGRAYAALIGALGLFDRTISSLLHPLYRWLAQRRFIKSRFISNRLNMRTFLFKRRYGTEFQLFLGERLIGRRKESDDEWRIKRPFRLLVESYRRSEDA